MKKIIKISSITASPTLVHDIRRLIISARQQVAQAVNSSLVILYWSIGKRIKIEILKNRRADYGRAIISTVSRQLISGFWEGFSDKNLRHMIRFVEVFPEQEIVYTLCRQLRWSHFRHIIYLKDDLKQKFYAEMCRLEGWSV